MLELCDATSGLIPTCLSTLWFMANPWYPTIYSSMLPFLHDMLVEHGMAEEDAHRLLLSHILDMASAVWARFGVIYNEHPRR